MRWRMPCDRVFQAVLQNLDTWIADGTAGIDGNDPRRDLLHLTRNMMQARMALQRMVADALEDEKRHNETLTGQR